MVLKTECCENCINCWEEFRNVQDWCALHHTYTYPDNCCKDHEYYMSGGRDTFNGKKENKEFIRRIIKWY